MQDILETQNNFKSLSIRDLLDARDQYHWHLMNRTNVVGTAVGLYLIRKPGVDRNAPRTFANSQLQKWSWPCVLVMVREWLKPSEFGAKKGQARADQMVPKTLYLPDGRSIPVCVVKVEPAEPSEVLVPDWHWPESQFGSGMPIIARTQSRDHRATAGCLVSDGHTTYALTSRHVCGERGEPVFTLAGGVQTRIGVASDRHLSRAAFDEIYPEFPARRTYVNLDVGLIELDDVNKWTTSVFGLGNTGALADLNELNITLRLINAPVIASGAASGRLEGRIKAVFYRYKSIGGYDYISDFLIAPREDVRADEPVQQSHPGDSGAVWHLVTQKEAPGDAEDRQSDAESNEARMAVAKRKNGKAPDPFDGIYRPLAIQWGGQVFNDGSAGGEKHFAFALATSLTTVCSALDVELVLDHDTGARPYWGQLGHYSIGAFAIDKLTDNTLKPFFEKNAAKISFTIGNLAPRVIAKMIKDARENGDLIPLADVPDLVWKKMKGKNVGGRDTQPGGHSSTGPEHPTHYADIDEADENNETLGELSLANTAQNVDVAFWQAFYTKLGHNKFNERGLLPFRVWQFFDSMVEFALAKQPDKFLCAAGLVSHYVGDACQPLHGSIFSQGLPDGSGGDGVHSVYETDMIDRYAPDIITGLPNETFTTSVGPITTGKQAAIEIIKLMDRSATLIPPEKLVKAYIAAGGTPHAAERDKLWTKFGDDTITVLADGTRVLAKIWQGAWTKGKGNKIPAAKLKSIAPSRLMDLYNDEDFVPSLDLDHIGPVLK